MKLSTVDIKGKKYVQVNERIRAFRSHENYKGFRLVTKVNKLTEEEVIMEAIVYNAEGVEVANGHAHEIKSSSFINKTSFIENCETSAWGRALGNLGIGVDTSIATAEEVSMAIEKQNEIKDPSPQKTATKVLTEEMKTEFLEKRKLCGLEITQATEDWLDNTAKFFDIDKAIKDMNKTLKLK